MDLYEALKTVHVLTAVVWVGGNVYANIINTRRIKGASSETVVETAREAEWYGNHVLIPTTLLLIITAFGMTADADLSLGEFWLSFALAGFIFSFILGAAVVGPTIKKFHQEVTAAGNEVTPSAKAKLDKILLLARIELVILVLVVIDMVVKPGL